MPSSAPRHAGAHDHAGMIRLRRRALHVVLVVAAAASLIVGAVAIVTATPALFAWVGLGAFTSIVSAVQVLVGSADLRVAAAAHALAVTVAAASAPPGSVPAVVVASATVGVLMVALMGRRVGSVVVGTGMVALYAVVLLAVSPGPAAVVGTVALVAGAAVAWVLLTSVVAVVLEGEGSYLHLFDRVPVGLYRTALSGELLDVNPALADLLGYDRAEVVGRNARDLLFDPADLDRLRDELATGRDPLITDLRFRRADGEIIWVRDHTRAVKDDQGRLVCFEGELQDVTEERRHLEELESLVRSKSELIGAVSHELRTPLTAVVGFLDVLIGSMGEASPEQRELLSMAAEQAHEVAGIVEDLLTAARIDNHELVIHRETFAVVDAVETALRSLGVSAGDGIAIDIPDGVLADADPGRVRQILRNLIGNALRHGTPPIRVDASVSEAGTVHVVVSDHGGPIPFESADLIFEPFYSGADATSQPGSIGLGLHVSRRLARLMGGELEHRRVGDETQFVLTLLAAGDTAKVA